MPHDEAHHHARALLMTSPQNHVYKDSAKAAGLIFGRRDTCLSARLVVSPDPGVTTLPAPALVSFRGHPPINDEQRLDFRVRFMDLLLEQAEVEGVPLPTIESAFGDDTFAAGSDVGHQLGKLWTCLG